MCFNKDLLKFRYLDFSFLQQLLHIFYTKIVDSLDCNLCRHNLQFLVSTIKTIRQKHKSKNLISVSTKTTTKENHISTS